MRLLLLYLYAALVLSVTAHVARPAQCRACIPDWIRNKPAIGFNIGQSYGTAVSYLDNGTSINIAKIPNTPRLTRLLQQLTHPPSSWLTDLRLPNPDYDSPSIKLRKLVRSARRALGLPANQLTGEITNMLGQLKDAADGWLGTQQRTELDAVLDRQRGSRVTHAGVSAMHQMPPWGESGYMEGVIEEAMYASNLWKVPGDTERVFIGDAEAAMLSVDMTTCWPYGCDGASAAGTDQRDSRQPGVYFITYTNESLYTRLIPDHCAHSPSHETQSSISAKYGLSRAGKYDFEDVLQYLGEQVARLDEYKWFSAPITAMVVAGEACEDADFVEAVAGASRMLIEDNRAPEWSTIDAKGNTIVTIPRGKEIRVVFARDPAFAAARGAAMWQRMRMEKSHYCPTLPCCPNVLMIDAPKDAPKDEL